MKTHDHDGTEPITALNRPRPLGSLLAAATRITDRSLTGRNAQSFGQDWQGDAWEMYDLIGEEHFLATTLANRLGQARLYVGMLADDPTDPPEPVEDGEAAEVFAAFGGSHGAQSQLVARLGVNLFVAGDGWLVGIPRQLIPGGEPADPDQPAGQTRQRAWTPGTVPAGRGPDGIAPTQFGPDGGLLTLSDLEWRMLSVSEVKIEQGKILLQLDGDGKEDQITVKPDDVFLVRVWRPHPRKWWQADSPTRASLPVLRELVGLTEHVSAQVDSRLAGAGVLVVPQSARDAFLSRAGEPEDDEDDDDPFTEALMEAMLTPIKDRSNASAYVPLVVTVPDEATEKFHHIDFASQLDAESRNLREEAIRRLALGQDCPPEVLLGMGDSSHWSAWLVREDTITTHIEPPLALICDALTTQFLRPVLIQQGMDAEAAEQYVVWYDVSHMIMRPNRIQDAADLHAAGVISDEAYRDAAGFSDNDAPTIADPAVTVVMEMVKAAPSLAQSPGLPVLVDQVRQILTGTPATPVPATPTDQEPPADDGEGDIAPPTGTINDVDVPADPATAPAAAAATIRFDGEPMMAGPVAAKIEAELDSRERRRRLDHLFPIGRS